MTLCQGVTVSSRNGGAGTADGNGTDNYAIFGRGGVTPDLPAACNDPKPSRGVVGLGGRRRQRRE